MDAIRRVMNKKGNVAILWVASLPIFALLFCFIGTLAVVWMTHSSSQVAADAASLAATKKMDGWVQQDLEAKIRAVKEANGDLSPDDPGYQNPYMVVLGTDEKKKAFMNGVIHNHQGELKKIVQAYAKKNGGGDEGMLTLGKSGRIKVSVETPFRSLFFEEYFKDQTVEGSGTGPSRYYLEWLSDEERTIEY
ncbi:pilus assembly protein TadG-related protein [Paludifilum halophilum]|uniref:Putative Flp pilus-assembly TadG-like N-terminal domain-containing protein n=1 Tax=Paludifilum halophilum TaxID=1642702 RepID=A0A235B267_9BACL|nr:pilus assembly protein TadG-related protein [Paludifilum halophilum]OYD06321.1 hypothetical protein CHM34_16520 [Paludifilum halophilum]